MEVAEAGKKTVPPQLQLMQELLSIGAAGQGF